MFLIFTNTSLVRVLILTFLSLREFVSGKCLIRHGIIEFPEVLIRSAQSTRALYNAKVTCLSSSEETKKGQDLARAVCLSVREKYFRLILRTVFSLKFRYNSTKMTRF